MRIEARIPPSMETRPVLQNLKGRIDPSHWGIVVVFVLMAFFLRFVAMGTRPVSPAVVLFLGVLLAGCFLLSPLAWLWTGDPKPKHPLGRGSIRSILWNAVWMTVATGIFMAGEALLGQGDRYPPFLNRMSLATGLHPLVLLDLFATPLVFLAGWLISERDAAHLARREAEGRQRALAESLKVAEARALQAELDPHVLYNALGGLAELARKDPAATERALLDFSGYYRRVTACAGRRLIPVREERELLELFLSIEGLRFGDRLQVAWTWPDSLGNLLIPPLLLQPVVENAVKHGIAPSETGGRLRLELARRGERVHLVVENEGVPLEEPWRAGRGLSNLARRLENMEPRGAFRLLRLEWGTRVEMDLPLVKKRDLEVSG